MVSGYQADVGVSVAGNVWGSLYDESRRHRMLVMADSAVVAQALPGGIDPDGWQDYKIRSEGDRVEIWVNNIKTVDDYEKAKAMVQLGTVCVQIHGGPAQEVWYKDITIKETK